MQKIILLLLCAVLKYLWCTEINILHIDETSDTSVGEVIQAAISYLNEEQPHLNLSINLIQAEPNATDISKLCKPYDEVIARNKILPVVLDTTITHVQSVLAKNFSRELQLPTVSGAFGNWDDIKAWQDINSMQRKYLIQVRPPLDVLPHIVRTIITQVRNITSAAILFDKSYYFEYKYSNLSENTRARHVIKSIPEDRNKTADLLQLLRNFDVRHFFILGKIDSIEKVLNSKDCQFYTKLRWIAITEDDGDIELNCNMNLTITRARAKREYDKKLNSIHKFILNNDISSIFYFDLTIRTILSVRELIATNKWPNMTILPILHSCENTNRIPARNARNIDLQAHFLKVNESMTFAGYSYPANLTDMNGQTYMNFDIDVNIVNYDNGSESYTDHVGTYNAGFHMTMATDEINKMYKYEQRPVYRIYIVKQIPFIDNNTEGEYEGFCIDLIKKIAEEVEFDYEIYSENVFGFMDKNGTWNGIVRKLMDKEADIGLGAMSVMAEREAVIDFTVPFYDLVGISILMKIPKPLSQWFQFVKVLKSTVWFAIIGAYFITCILLWLFDTFSPFSYHNNPQLYGNTDGTRIFSFRECLWFCLTSLTPQGGGEAPKNLSGKLLTAFWWLFGFLIVASYTAQLAAFFTLSRIEEPIESMEDLIKQYKVSYAPLKNSSEMRYFERMMTIEKRFFKHWKTVSLNDSLSAVERSKLAVWDFPIQNKYTKIWKAINDAGMPDNISEAIERVRASESHSGFAFLGDATDVRYHSMVNCDLEKIGQEWSRKPYAIAVQQGSPLKDKFDTILLSLLSKRWVEGLEKRWWPERRHTEMCGEIESRFDGLSIKNICGFFTVILTGIFFSCVALIFEYFHYKHIRRQVSNFVEGTHRVPPNSSDRMMPDVVKSDSEIRPESILTFRNKRKSLPY